MSHSHEVGLRRRIGSSIVDQAVNSGTNFFIAAIGARLLEPADFGGFVVALSIAYFFIGVQRAVIGDPMLIHVPGLEAEQAKRSCRDALSVALLLGAIGFTTMLMIGLVGSELTEDLVFVAPWMPMVLVQDASRYVFLSSFRPTSALVSDGLWALVQTSAVGIAFAADIVTPEVLSAAWGFGATAGAFFYLALARMGTFSLTPQAWFRSVAQLSRSFLGISVLNQVHQQCILLIPGALLSAESTGAIRSVQLLAFQPVQLLNVAIIAILVPTMVKLRAAGRQREIFGLMRRLTLLLLSMCAVGIAFVSVWHDSLIELTFPEYAEAGNSLIPFAVFASIYLVTMPAQVVLRTLRSVNSVFVAQFVATVLTVPGIVVGALTHGVAGVSWALVITSLPFVVIVGTRCMIAVRAEDNGSRLTASTP